MRKTKNYLQKTPNDLEKLHQDFSEEGKEERPAAYNLENCSNFKNNFSFNNGSIYEIHDYFRTRENASYNDLCQLIDTLSNQDFAVSNVFCCS